MNSISNNKVRIVVCWILLIVVCVTMTFIPQKSAKPQTTTPPPKPQLTVSDADQVCITGALYESWMYVVTDKDFLNKTSKMLDGLKYEKSDKAVNMMNAKEVYSLTYSKGNEQIKTFIIDINGMMSFEAGGQSYKITSDFDFSELDRLIQEQKEINKQ